MKKLIHILDSRFSFKRLLWLIPCILTVHNLEEALTMPQWVSDNHTLISSVIPGIVSFSKAQLLLSLASATILPFLLTAACVNGNAKSLRLKILLGLQVIVLINVIVPHILLSAWWLMYNPGVITAVLFNLPFSSYLFYRSISGGFITRKDFFVIFIVDVVLYLPVVYANHEAGKIAGDIFFSLP